METGIAQYSSYIIYLVGFFVLIIGIQLVIIAFARKKRNQHQANYLDEHPDTARVYLSSRAGITAETLQVLGVDGDTPQPFVENGQSGIYLAPGRHILEIDYTYTRPGVIYKNVSKTTGLVKYQVEVEPYLIYRLAFDRKAEEFIFELLSKPHEGWERFEESDQTEEA